MERGNLIKAVLKYLRFQGENETQHELIPQDEFFYYALIPTVVSVAVLALLRRRRWKWLDVLDGRPGLPCPINLLEDQDNRLAYVAAFGLTSWTAWDALTGDIPFKWSNENLFVKNLARLSTCLMSALICYPIFGSIASNHVIGYAVGGVYIWMYSLVYLISNYPLERGQFGFTVDILQIIPAFVCMIYLCVHLPWKCWQRGVAEWRHCSQAMHEDTLYEWRTTNCPSFRYVRQLLAANRPEVIVKRKRTLEIARSKFYRSIPEFRYSLSVLVGILVSVQFVYVGTLDVIKFYHSVITELGRPMSAPTSNDTQPIIQQLIDTEIWSQAQYYLNEMHVWLNAFEVSCYISAGLAFLTTSAAVLLTLRSYRWHLLLLYRGNRLPAVPALERETRPTFIVASAAKYVGYQFGYAIWGFVYQAALLLVMCCGVSALHLLIFRYHKFQPIVKWIFNVIGPIVTYIGGLVLVQRVLARFCFLQRDEQGRLVLAFENRRLLWNFQYFMVFANSTMGLVSCFIRIFKAIVFGAWTLPRLDVSMLNRHFERFDNGYAAYAALLAIESSHTNPVLVTFTKLLWISLRSHPNCGESEELGEIDKPNKRLISTRSKTIRNRWHLYVTLHHNPGLRLFRKEAIRIDRMMHAEEVILDDILIEAPRLRLLFRRFSEHRNDTFA